MAQSRERRSGGTDWLSLVSLGFFLMLLGVTWIITPNLWNEVVDFAVDLFSNVKKSPAQISLFAPARDHPVVYTAAMQFCLAFGVFQIVILALKFIFREPVDRTTGTISGIVFWLGVGYFLNMLAAGEIGWFGFVGGLIICIGLLIIVSSLVKLLFKRV